MEINEEFARIILEMEDVCISEGMGPENQELIKRIFDEFPNLKEEYDIKYYLRNV